MVFAMGVIKFTPTLLILDEETIKQVRNITDALPQFKIDGPRILEF